MENASTTPVMNQPIIVDFAIEQAARSIANLIGYAYRTNNADVPSGLYSFTLYYDQPGIAASGKCDPDECSQPDRDKVAYVMKLHLGEAWQEKVIIKTSQPVLLDDGTFIVTYLIAIEPETDFWQGDIFEAERMLMNADLKACIHLDNPRSLQEALRDVMIGPNYDPNWLKIFARDMNSEALANGMGAPVQDL